MSEDKKPSKEIIGKAYDKIANEVRHKGGINPYAYRLGFVDGWVAAAASPVSDAGPLLTMDEHRNSFIGALSFWFNITPAKEKLGVPTLAALLKQYEEAIMCDYPPTPTNVQEQDELWEMIIKNVGGDNEMENMEFLKDALKSKYTITKKPGQ